VKTQSRELTGRKNLETIGVLSNQPKIPGLLKRKQTERKFLGRFPENGRISEMGTIYPTISEILVGK